MNYFDSNPPRVGMTESETKKELNELRKKYKIVEDAGDFPAKK